jgi:hypothetical protein
VVEHQIVFTTIVDTNVPEDRLGIGVGFTRDQ